MINGKKIKEVLAKTILLTTISGALVVKNPVDSDNGVTVVYAAQSLDEYQSKTLKYLEKVYKNYNKAYYTEKEYKKLTTQYNKGVKAIKACNSKSAMKETYEQYKEILNGIKPSILVKYQTKLVKSLNKTYNSLKKNNEYSDGKFAELEKIYNEGIEKINSAKNKTKSKKAKTSAASAMKKVTVLVTEMKERVISYVNSIKDLSEADKTTIIENVNSLNNVDDIIELGEIYGYDDSVYDYITVEQINAKVKELSEKYKEYSEDEIRVLVATANMDYVKEEDIFAIFNVNSKDELEAKAAELSNLYEEMISNVADEKMVNWRTGNGYGLSEKLEEYKKQERNYNTMPKINDLFIKQELKKQADFIFERTDTMVQCPELVRGTSTEGSYASFELISYFYNNYNQVERFEKMEIKRGQVYDFSDPVLDGSAAGYFLNKYMTDVLTYIAPDNCFMVFYNDESRFAVRDYGLGYENPIEKVIG